MPEAGDDEWIELRVRCAPEAAEAVCDLLLREGAGGVVEEGAQVRVAYLPREGDVEARIRRIGRQVAGLSRFGLDPGPAEVTWRIVAEESWADAWKEHFYPIRLGERVTVRPTWREYTPSEGEIVIDLDPGMAFGTGQHPTTALCVRLLERLVSPGALVLDVGTGSGILAIAAARLGAERVWACDIDPVAVRAARANVEANGVSDRVEVFEGSWPAAMAKGLRVDLVVANILASVIEAMAPDVHALLRPGGRFVASGIVAFRKSGVTASLRRAGWDVRATYTQGEWAAIESAPKVSSARVEDVGL